MDHKVPASPLSKGMELTAWVLVLLALALAIWGMCTLPDTIATHFDGAGNPDGYGKPGILILFPILEILVLGIFSLVTHLVAPENWNMPFRVEKQNAGQVYSIIAGMLAAVELETAVYFLLIEIQTIRQSGKGFLLGVGLYLGAMTLTLVLGIWRAWRKSREPQQND